MKRKIFSLLAGVGVALGAMAAEPNTLYFMNYLPYRTYMNPALQPMCGTYIELPGISTIQASVGNNSLQLNDFFYLNDDKKMVNFLHPEYGNKDQFFAKLKRNERLYTEMGVTVLGFGSRVAEKGYFSFNLALRADANVFVPRDFFKFALYGTPDTTGVNNYNLKSLGVDANVYLDINGGYSHKINEHWTVGGRAHILVGVANANATFSDLDLNATADYWQIEGQGKMKFSMPSYKVEVDKDGHVVKGYMETTDIDNILRNYEPSIGATFDLGMEYKPIKDLSLSLSVKDLGFMCWQNAHMAHGDIDYTFDGVEYKYNHNTFEQYGDSLAEVFKQSYKYQVGQDSKYFTMMHAKIYAGIEYSFLRNMMSVGALSKTEFVGNKVFEEVTVAYNLRPCRWFSMSASYSAVSGGWSTLGLGLNIRLSPFSIYVVGDYMPLYYAVTTDDEGNTDMVLPYRSKAFNIQAGIVLTIGCKNKKFVPYHEQTNFADY